MLPRLVELLGFGPGFKRERDGLIYLDILDAKPTDGTAGYGVQCIVLDKTNGILYVNEGTAASCSFAQSEALSAAQEALLGATAGTAAASKAVILDASKDIAGINDVSLAGLTSSDLTATTVVLSSAAKKLESSGVTPTELNFLDSATAGTQVASKAVIADANINSGISKVTELHIGATGSETQVTSTAAELNILDDVTADKDEINFLDGATAGTQVASKAVIADANINTGISKITELHIGATGSETQVTSTAAELNILDDVTADKDEINFLDGATAGTQVASKAVIADANINSGVSKVTELHIGATGSEVQVTATPAEINQLDGAIVADMAITAGVGITGTADNFASKVEKIGTLFKTTIVIDVDGLNCGGANDDIIGADGAGVAHLGQITAARSGTIFAGTLTCIEAPTGGDEDIDIHSATEDSGVEDVAISTLTETKLCDSGDLVAGSVIPLTAYPAANEYLYLTCGTFTDATYTAGILVIELWGK